MEIDPVLLALDGTDRASDVSEVEDNEVDELADFWGEEENDEDGTVGMRRLAVGDHAGGPESRGAGDGVGREETADDGEGDEEGEAVFSRLAGLVARPGAEGGEGDAGPSKLLRDELEHLDDDEEGARRPTRKRGARRTRRPHVPANEVQTLLGKANMRVITGDIAGAVPNFLEVIRMDNRVLGAWTALATCYEEMGREDEARQIRLCAAHLENDPEEWRSLASAYRTAGQEAEALYCLSRNLKLDPTDLLALWEMAGLYKQQGRASKAVDAFKRILKHDPPSAQDFTLLMDFHPLMVESKQIAYATQLFRSAFDYHVASFASPSDQPESSTAPNTMALEHVIALVDLLMQSESLEEALLVLRRGQRWIQGRRGERHWDSMEDDREYDPPGVIRPGAEKEEDEGDETGEGNPLDLNLRHRLALLRSMLGNDSEAEIHAEEIIHLDVEQYHSLISELGMQFYKREMWRLALDCFAVIQQNESVPDEPRIVYHIAVCHQQLHELGDAVEALRHVIAAEPQNFEAKLRLANVLEEQGHKAEALELVSDVLKSRRAGAGRAATDQPGPGEKKTKADKVAARKLNKRVLEDQMRERMDGLWVQVQQAEAGIAEGMNGALDQFTYAAGTMIETFRMARGNFNKNRGVIRVAKRAKGSKEGLDAQAEEMQDRLERVIGVEDDVLQDIDEKYIVKRQIDFYGLDCETWLSLVIKAGLLLGHGRRSAADRQYCSVLMAKNEEDVGLDILEHVLWAGLFNNPRSEVAIRLTIIAGAMRLKQYDKVVDSCKRLMQMHQFRAEPLHLMLAALSRGGQKAHRIWTTNTTSRFIHRDLQIYEDAVRGIKMNYNAKNRRWNPIIKVGLSRRLGDNVDEEEEEGAREEDRPRSRSGSRGKVQSKDRGKEKGGRAVSKTRGSDDDDEKNSDDDDDDDQTEALDEADESTSRVDAEELDAPPVKPTRPTPDINVVYGQYLLTTRSYQSALFYFFRAYEICQYDAYLCLLIAQAYFGRSANRQADNKNYMIAQGMAFLVRYRKLRIKDEYTLEEVEYNYGRAFHGIGVTHLAIKHYEKVLDLVKARMEGSSNPDEVRRSSSALDAAHNLVLLYAAVGSNDLVKERSKWLAI